MKREHRWVVAALLLGVLVLPACREVTAEEPTVNEPYRLEPVEGTDVSRVILTEDGAQRIGLETVTVVESGAGSVVPASAIWIDVEGQEWVYTSPEALTFVREPVVVDRYEDDVAVLSDGPAPGTEVVAVGVPELIGSELGI
jgi:hypothetical protein